MAQIVFLASPHLRNLADRLAHRFNGTSAHSVEGPIHTRMLVILANGLGVTDVLARRNELKADETLVISIGLDEAALGWAFGEARYKTIPAEPAVTLWSRVQACVSGDPPPEQETTTRPRVFISHAVMDEPLIYPALEALRSDYGLELFVCADSIDAGADWHGEIMSHIRECERFVVLSSESSGRSLFCAFEAGVAAALEKSIRVVKLDESDVPIHLRDRQAIDVPRLMSRKPWLTQVDAILDACLTAVTGGH